MSNGWKPHLAGLAHANERWPSLAESCQQWQCAPHMVKCTMEGNSVKQAPPSLTQSMTNTPSEWHFLQGSGANHGCTVESPREPQKCLWPGFPPRLIKINICRSGGPCTGVSESSPDDSRMQPRGGQYCRVVLTVFELEPSWWGAAVQEPAKHHLLREVSIPHSLEP